MAGMNSQKKTQRNRHLVSTSKDVAGRKDRQKKYKTWGYIAAIVAVIGILAIWLNSCGSGGSDKPSQGAAEVACERSIKNEVGRDVKISYSQKIELFDGQFMLHGTAQTSYGAQKFMCDVTNSYRADSAHVQVTWK